MMSHIRDFSRFLRISSTAAALATHPPAHDGPSRPSNAPRGGPRSPPVAWRAWGLVPHIPRPQSRPPRPTLPPLPSLHDAVRQLPGGEVVVGRRASPQRPQRVRVASLSTGAPGSKCLCKQKARGGQRGSGRGRNLNARGRARAKYGSGTRTLRAHAGGTQEGAKKIHTRGARVGRRDTAWQGRGGTFEELMGRQLTLEVPVRPPGRWPSRT